MSENILSSYKKKLFKSRAGCGKSSVSKARGVSRNEALKLIKENPKAISKDSLMNLRVRILTLSKPVLGSMSPFNPPTGLYVFKVQDQGRCMYVEALGLQRHEVSLRLINFILHEAYDARIVSHPTNKYKGVILCRGEEIGDVFYVGNDENLRLKIRIKRLRQRITIKSWSEGWVVKNTITCPAMVKEKALPKLRKLEEDYWNLCITKPKLFYQFG